MTVRSEGQFNTVVYETEDFYRGQERRDVILLHPDDAARLGFAEEPAGHDPQRGGRDAEHSRPPLCRHSCRQRPHVLPRSATFLCRGTPIRSLARRPSRAWRFRSKPAQCRMGTLARRASCIAGLLDATGKSAHPTRCAIPPGPPSGFGRASSCRARRTRPRSCRSRSCPR